MPKVWLDYAECRLDTGHHWRTIKDLGIVDANWTKVQRCRECGSTRKRGWNVWTGALTPYGYKYAPGYLQEGPKKLSLKEQRIQYAKQALRPRNRKLSKAS